MKKIVVLASGNGTNFQAIVDAIDNGVIEDAKISKLICNNKRANVMQRARDSGILPVLIDTKSSNYNDMLSEIISGDDPDLIVLDGYIKILPEFIINKFMYKIINIHPSLLPAFGGKGYYGRKVHEAVIMSGTRFSGCTIHFATNDVDNGPIIDQRAVTVDDYETLETLEEEVHKEEHKSLVFSINLILKNNYEIKGKRVIHKV